MAIRVSLRCTGCGACIHVCPARALSLESERPDGFGRKRAAVNARRCTGCGDCIVHCRHLALGVEERASHLGQVGVDVVGDKDRE